MLQVGLGREHPNRDPRLTTPQEGRKWEDVLGSAGLRVDYRPIWYWVSPLVLLAGTVGLKYCGLLNAAAAIPLLYHLCACAWLWSHRFVWLLSSFSRFGYLSWPSCIQLCFWADSVSGHIASRPFLRAVGETATQKTRIWKTTLTAFLLVVLEAT